MKRVTLLSAAAFLVVILSGSVFAQATGQGPQRLNGNPNSTPLMTNWVDLNGDGICDNFGTENQGMRQKANNQGRRGKGGNGTGTATGQGLFNGFGDGSGIRPQDGTGFGRGNGSGTGTGTGVCDGTGTGDGTGTAAQGRGRRGNK
ncbi:MAG: hypothetical protein KKA84_02955 [Bacteroidetes bacterium]|nr:hypothetical protein [Bacteroidota bacterium]